MTDILDLIDGAIADATSPDAMRWTPEDMLDKTAPPLDDESERRACDDIVDLLNLLSRTFDDNVSRRVEQRWQWVMGPSVIDRLLAVGALAIPPVLTVHESRLFGLPVCLDERATVPRLEPLASRQHANDS